MVVEESDFYTIPGVRNLDFRAKWVLAQESKGIYQQPAQKQKFSKLSCNEKYFLTLEAESCNYFRFPSYKNNENAHKGENLAFGI